MGEGKETRNESQGGFQVRRGKRGAIGKSPYNERRKSKEPEMSVDELLSAVENLNEPDLESLVNRALFLRARLRSPVLSSEETGLLPEINQGIPQALNERYQVLLERRDAEILSEVEYGELLMIGEQIEAIGVKRIEALAKLSTIRQVPLLILMDSLGIQSPGVR